MEEIVYDEYDPRPYCEVSAKDGAVLLYLESQEDGEDPYGMTQKLTPAQALALIASLTNAVAALI